MRIYAFFILFFLYAAALYSQPYIFKKLSYKEGLNTYNIQKTIEDRFGFIWVATQDGLYRFDGKYFECIRRSSNDANSICGNFLFDICYDGKDALYLGCYEGGIDELNIRTLQVRHLVCKANHNFRQLPNGFIKKLTLDSLRQLWINGEDYVARLNLFTTKLDFPLKEFYAGKNVQIKCLTVLNQFTLVAGIDSIGLVLIDAASGKVIKIVERSWDKGNASYAKLTALICASELITFITGSELISGCFIKGEWIQKKHTSLQNSITGTVTCAVGNSQYLWMAASGILFRYNYLTNAILQVSLNSDKGMVGTETVRDIYADGNNNLWVSTSKQLHVCNLERNGVKAFRRNELAPMPHLFALIGRDSNHIYATSTEGLYEADLKKTEFNCIPFSQTLGTVHHLQKIVGGNYILSADKGMYLFNENNLQISRGALLKQFPEWQPYQNFYFGNAIQHGEKQYWVSQEEEGLLIWNQLHHSMIRAKAGTTIHKGLKENLLHNIKKDGEGYAWLLSNNSVARFDLDRDTVIESFESGTGADNLQASIFFDMYDDSANLWFGSYGGGICILNKESRQWRYLTEKEGLCNNAVYTLLPEGKNYVWAATNNGLSRIHIATGHCTNYYESDGLQSNAFDERGGLAWNGCLYFAGVDGFSEINLKNFSQDSFAENLYIRKIEYFTGLNRSVINDINPVDLRMPAGTNVINIYLSIPDIRNQEKYRIYYRLGKAAESPYLQVGSDNIIEINGLGYGSYELQIKYQDAVGHIKLSPQTLKLIIQPHWYETIWLKIAIILALAAIFYALYRYRLSQLKAREAIRRKIASDLHDDLGSTLTSIRIFTDLAIRQNPKDFLSQIKQGVQDAMAATRDMIWVMDRTRNNAAQLAEKINSFTLVLLKANEINFELQEEEGLEDVLLQADVQRDLYLMVKEFITNSLKYANCTKIQVRINKHGKKIAIIVRDNGTGFDMNTIKRGKGISNILARADAINYKATFESDTGGTMLQLVPIKRFIWNRLLRYY